jgi:hypothetical protein
MSGRARRGWRHRAAGGPPSGTPQPPTAAAPGRAGRGASCAWTSAALILRATGAADLGPEVLIGLLVTSLEQANLAPVLQAKWRERGEAASGPKAP